MNETLKYICRENDRIIISNDFLFIRFNSGGEHKDHTELRSVVFWMFGFGFIIFWNFGDFFFQPRQIMATYGKRGIRSLYFRMRKYNV